jgi:saccharopine dehydrogenase-like NADP-dependent oxidoreductase
MELKMNHYLVLGAGKMGIVLAKDLVNSDPNCQVTLVDINSMALQNAEEFIQNERMVMIQKDLEDKNQRDAVIEGKDVVLCALLHRHALPVLESAIKYGVHFVDLIGEGTLARLKYDEEAKKKGISTITGCGVSPGITNVCVSRGGYLLDEVEDLGSFMELEVVLGKGDGEKEGEAIACDLKNKLGIDDSSLIEVAYIDLIEEQSDAKRTSTV